MKRHVTKCERPSGQRTSMHPKFWTRASSQWKQGSPFTKQA